MTKTKEIPARVVFAVLVLVLCLFAASLTVMHCVTQGAAYADEINPESEPSEAEAEAEPHSNINLYIVLGIVAALLLVIIVVVIIANKKYILAFIVGKHAAPLPPRKYLAGDYINDLPEPARKGAKFGGWYQDAYLKQPFNMTNMPKKDTFIYAKWKRRMRWYYIDKSKD